MTLLLHDIQGNSQKLDGGAMFGNAPKALWQRWLVPDEQNRIKLCCRALLAQVDGKNVLLETGIGSFFEPKLKARFGVIEDEHVLLDSLKQHGLSHEDIDVVILSHLHFDHAGGLLAAYEAGQPPRLLFPKAEFVTSKAAFERALHPHPRDRASYIPELPQLLQQSGRLTLLEEPLTHPGLGDKFSFQLSNGHTPGMLHTTIKGTHQQLLFCADLIPGAAWLHLPITMGYDRFPEALIDEKSRVLAHALESKQWLFFTHDHEFAASQVVKDERGRYTAGQSLKTFGEGLDLDAPMG